jgi:hypothetical protein
LFPINFKLNLRCSIGFMSVCLPSDFIRCNAGDWKDHCHRLCESDKHRMVLQKINSSIKTKLEIKQKFISLKCYDSYYSNLFSAKIFNIYPRKGAILEGSDADIIILNPKRSFVMGTHTHHSRSNTNVYEGRKGKVGSSLLTSHYCIWHKTLGSNLRMFLSNWCRDW